MTYVNIHTEIPKRVRMVMTQRRMTLKELSHRSGLSLGWLSGMRSGDYVNPLLANVIALAGALDVDPFWLMGRDED